MSNLNLITMANYFSKRGFRAKDVDFIFDFAKDNGITIFDIFKGSEYEYNILTEMYIAAIKSKNETQVSTIWNYNEVLKEILVRYSSDTVLGRKMLEEKKDVHFESLLRNKRLKELKDYFKNNPEYLNKTENIINDKRLSFKVKELLTLESFGIIFSTKIFEKIQVRESLKQDGLGYLNYLKKHEKNLSNKEWNEQIVKIFEDLRFGESNYRSEEFCFKDTHEISFLIKDKNTIKPWKIFKSNYIDAFKNNKFFINPINENALDEHIVCVKDFFNNGCNYNLDSFITINYNEQDKEIEKIRNLSYIYQMSKVLSVDTKKQVIDININTIISHLDREASYSVGGYDTVLAYGFYEDKETKAYLINKLIEVNYEKLENFIERIFREEYSSKMAPNKSELMINVINLNYKNFKCFEKFFVGNNKIIYQKELLDSNLIKREDVKKLKI